MTEKNYYCMIEKHYSPLKRLVKKHTGYIVVAEWRFHPTREWRFDFAIPDRRIAIEVEGGIWNGGRHIRPEGFLRDMEKYNEAAAAGWLLIRVAPAELLSLRTLQLIVRACEERH